MPDNETKTWIQSGSGRAIPLLTPNLSRIVIGDIAYALAGINRYTGHARPRYNVAEHSCRVSDLAGKLATKAGKDPGYVLRCKRGGLLHDAAEAYIGDVSRPLKNALQALMPDERPNPYKILEKCWDEAIAIVFGLPSEMPAEVREADYLMLGVEADQIMQPLHPDWGKTCPGGLMPPPDRSVRLGWGPRTSEMCFLRRYRSLFG